MASLPQLLTGLLDTHGETAQQVGERQVMEHERKQDTLINCKNDSRNVDKWISRRMLCSSPYCAGGPAGLPEAGGGGPALPGDCAGGQAGLQSLQGQSLAGAMGPSVLLQSLSKEDKYEAARTETTLAIAKWVKVGGAI